MYEDLCKLKLSLDNKMEVKFVTIQLWQQLTKKSLYQENEVVEQFRLNS